MKLISSMMVVLIICLGSAAHTAPATRPAPKTIADVKPPFTFKVHVTDRDDKPQPGVKIHCRHPRKDPDKPLDKPLVDMDSVSDTSGTAVFQVTAGDLMNDRWYWFEVNDEKFVGTSVGLSPIDNEYEETIKAAPAVFYKVQVVDDKGAPIGGAEIRLETDDPKSRDDEEDQFTVYASGETTSSGLAVIKFHASPANIITAAKGHASSLKRQAKLTTDKPYVMKLRAGLTIRGKVLDDAGNPLKGVSVSGKQIGFSMNYLPEFTLRGESNEAGEFELKDAASVGYELTAWMKSGDRALTFDPVSVIATQTAPIEMKGKPGALLKGRFVSSQKKWTAGRDMFLFVQAGQGRSDSMSQHFKSTADGTFNIPLPAKSTGRISLAGMSGYSLNISVPPTIKSVKAGSSWVEFENIAPGVYDGVEVKIVAAAILNGTVRDADGKPVPEITISTEPRDAYATTDVNGAFSTTITPNRQFKICVTEGWSNKTMHKTTRPFQAAEGAIVEQNIKLTRAATNELAKILNRDNAIVGQVVGPDGTPAAGATVYIGNSSVLAQNHGTPTWQDGIIEPAYSTTDTQGNFTFNNLMPGRTELWAEDAKSNRGYVRDVRTDAVDVKIVLKPKENMITLKGTLTEPDGKPAAGAQLKIYISSPSAGSGSGYSNDKMDVTANGKTDTAGRFSIEFKQPREGWASNSYHYLIAVAISKSGTVAWKLLPYCSVEDVKIQFKKTAPVRGRIVDSKSRPVKEADVRIYYATDPDYGMAYGSSENLAAPSKTGADGQFTILGIPETSDLGMSVEHPDYLRNHTYNGKQEDVVMDAGIILTGIVRHAETKEPAGGTTVTLQTLGKNYTVVTNDKGEYAIKGVQPIEHNVNMIAVGPTWFGRGSFKKKLNEGEDLKGLDIIVRDTPAAVKSGKR